MDNKYSEDLFQSYTESEEFKLRRSQRILERKSQTIKAVYDENYFYYMEIPSSNQTNDNSTVKPVRKDIGAKDDDEGSRGNFTFLFTSENSTSNPSSHNFDLLDQQQTLNSRSNVKTVVGSTATLKGSARKAKAKGRPKRNAVEECSSQKLSNLMDCESRTLPIQKSHEEGECEVLEATQLTEIFDRSVVDGFQHDRTAKGSDRKIRNPSIKFNERVEKFHQVENILPQVEGDVKMPLTYPIENDFATSRPKFGSIKTEPTIHVSGGRSKKNIVKNPRRQQRSVKNDAINTSKKKQTKLLSSSAHKRLKSEEIKSICPQNYVAPKVERYYHSCPNNNFARELFATNTSLLPSVYPPHFTQQIALAHREPAFQQNSSPLSLLPQLTYLTPENSELLEERDTVQPQLLSPTVYSIASIGEFFDHEELDEIQNTEKVIYHLTEVHVLSLALKLRINAEELFSLLDKIV